MPSGHPFAGAIGTVGKRLRVGLGNTGSGPTTCESGSRACSAHDVSTSRAVVTTAIESRALRLDIPVFRTALHLLIRRPGALPFAAGTVFGASCAVAGFDVETFPGGGAPSAVKSDSCSARVAGAAGGVRVALTILVPFLSKRSDSRSGGLPPERGNKRLERHETPVSEGALCCLSRLPEHSITLHRSPPDRCWPAPEALFPPRRSAIRGRGSPRCSPAYSS